MYVHMYICIYVYMCICIYVYIAALSLPVCLHAMALSRFSAQPCVSKGLLFATQDSCAPMSGSEYIENASAHLQGSHSKFIMATGHENF